MMINKAVLIVIGATAVLVACSVKAPELRVTGEKTALENQILGTYQQIANDTWLITSTRAVGSNQPVSTSEQKTEVLSAVQNRKFNKDEINELKREKVIGEGRDGFLKILSTSQYQADSGYRQRVESLIAEENQDRRIIYDRIIAVNHTAADADPSKLDEIYQKLNYDESEPGTLFEQTDGSWKEKPKR